MGAEGKTVVVRVAPDLSGRQHITLRLAALGHSVASWAAEQRRTRGRDYTDIEVYHAIAGRRTTSGIYPDILRDLADDFGIALEELMQWIPAQERRSRRRRRRDAAA